MLYILAAALSVLSYFMVATFVRYQPDTQILFALIVFFGVIIYGKVWMIHHDLKNKDK